MVSPELLQVLRAASTNQDETRLDHNSWMWFTASGWEKRTEKLFSCAAQVAEALAAD